MSEIRVGDLVMVVHTCHPVMGLGRIYTVVERVVAGPSCCGCGHVFGGGQSAILGRPGYTHDSPIPLSWLKKIDPLTEPEHITEEATA